MIFLSFENLVFEILNYDQSENSNLMQNKKIFQVRHLCRANQWLSCLLMKLIHNNLLIIKLIEYNQDL